MRYLLLGTGLQGRAIAHDLLQHATGTTGLHLVDRDADAVAGLADWLDDPRVTTTVGDVADEKLLAPLLDEADVCVSAVNYWFNTGLTRLAIAHGAHFLDLGGNNDVVAEQLAHDDAARSAGVTVIPDCGLAPGLAGILGHHLATGFDACESVRLRVGGLPADPQPPLDYALVFAVQGLINEYIEDCVVVRDGERRVVPGLSELETLEFPGFGELEAFQTSGGVSTLPETLAGKVRDIDYKTIRYRGHRDRIKLLMDLGLTASETVETNGIAVRPRDVLAACLERTLPRDGDDLVLLQVEADGVENGHRLRRSIRIVDRRDQETGLTAMMRMTGFPAAIVAGMLAGGEIDAPGARPQETVVPAERMLEELARRGIEASRGQETLD